MAVLDNLKYEMEEEAHAKAAIKVLGVGGCGSNAVAHMLAAGLEGAEFHVLNTDFQALQASPVPNKLALGAKVTHGRGAGGDPEIGKQAALEDTERIVELLQGADMVFITAGFGSGTGTGGAPVVANIAKNLGALTIAIIVKPFAFEGSKRMRLAEQGLEELAGTVDTVIAIPNDRLLALAPAGTSFVDAFRMGNEFVRQTVQDIVEIITTPGFINRDFSDLRSTMVGSGYAMLGTATAKGEHAAVEAARQAIDCALLENAGIRGATNILLNITGSSQLGLHDINDACALIRDAAGGEDVQITFGLVLNESMGEAVKVTIIATGFVSRHAPRAAAAQTAWLSEAPAPPPPPVIVEAPPEPPLRAGNGTPQIPEPEIYEDELDRPAIERRRRVLH